MMMQAEDIFLKEEVADIENQQADRDQENSESVVFLGLAGFVMTALAEVGMAVAIDSPRNVVDDPADNDRENGQTQEVDVVGVHDAIERIMGERSAESNRRAQRDEGSGCRKQAAENMREQAENTDRERRMSELRDSTGGRYVCVMHHQNPASRSLAM
jgi:hypothetical protein